MGFYPALNVEASAWSENLLLDAHQDIQPIPCAYEAIMSHNLS